ncbi:MAG: hypothetical protein ACI85F_001114 [Bacteroidia bacterium]|jgi:hypothetical protein
MKRKDFIASVGLLGFGLGLSPWSMLRAETGHSVVQLPEPSIHLRHGNFHASTVDELLLPDLSLKVQNQQFLANGIVPDSKDLMMYSFMRGSDFINVAVAGDEVEIIGNIPNVKVSPDLNRKAQLSAILVLRGVLRFENVSVSTNEILVIGGADPMIDRTQNCLVLGIYC